MVGRAIWDSVTTDAPTTPAAGARITPMRRIVMIVIMLLRLDGLTHVTIDPVSLR